MVGIGLDQLGIHQCPVEGGYECRHVHTPWYLSWGGQCGHLWWGVVPAVPPTIPPGLISFFLTRWPTKEEVKLGGWS
jgi:hypothetical protein